MLSSCLITQQTHFDQPPNSPPSIISTGVYPLSRVIRYPDDVVSTLPDAGMAPMPDIVLDVTVYDADVDQRLQFAALIDDSLVPCSGCSGDLPTSTLTTGRERRALSVRILGSQLVSTTARCRRITLIVTGGFNPATAQPRDPVGDTAFATWWVAVPRPMTTDVVDMSQCPRT
jgi:hypothetical protein